MLTYIGILFAVLSILTGFLLYIVTDDNLWFVWVLAGTIILVSLFILDQKAKIPTENDVLKGKAIYQETIHITNNDTIKTYKIVWKPKNQ